MIFDISPEISEEIAVWPGDTAFSRRVNLDFEQGHNLLLSEIHTSVHLGAHTDAPNHYAPRELGIAAVPLEPYIGDCQVISTSIKRGERIYPKDITGITISAPRILFRTDSYPKPNSFTPDFNSLSPELVEYLAGFGVQLVGIDTPSVDPFESKALESHSAIYKHRMAILEGIVLSAIPDGRYFLIALPLKLKDADASPVRAILLPESYFTGKTRSGETRASSLPK